MAITLLQPRPPKEMVDYMRKTLVEEEPGYSSNFPLSPLRQSFLVQLLPEHGFAYSEDHLDVYAAARVASEDGLVQILVRSNIKERGFPTEELAKNGQGITLITLPSISGLTEAMRHPKAVDFYNSCTKFLSNNKEIADYQKQQSKLDCEEREFTNKFWAFRPVGFMSAYSAGVYAVLNAVLPFVSEGRVQFPSPWFLAGSIGFGILMGRGIEYLVLGNIHGRQKIQREAVSGLCVKNSQLQQYFFRDFSDCDIRYDKAALKEAFDPKYLVK